MKTHKDIVAHVELEVTLYEQTKRELQRLLSLPPESISTPYIYHTKRIDHMTTIVAAITNAYEVLPEYKRRIIQLRYWSEPRMLTMEGIAKEVHVSRTQVFAYKNEFIEDICSQLGW